jgi:hypothetical protein
MQYSLRVHGDDDRVRHVDATSAEDALRQLLGPSPAGPVRATFVAADAEFHHTPDPIRLPVRRPRRGSRDSGHTRTGHTGTGHTGTGLAGRADR